MASVSTGHQDNQGDQENGIVEEPVTTSSEEGKQEEEEELILEPSDMSDVTLIVEGKKYKTHRVILSMWSPVFKSMLNAEFKEKESQEIPLPDKKAHQIREMLLVMYPTIMKPISEENCYFLLPLAEEYKMENLKGKCEDCLLGTVQEAKDYYRCAELLILSQDYSLERLLKCCKAEMETLDLKHIMGWPRYKEITDKNLVDIYIGKIQKLENRQMKTAEPAGTGLTGGFAQSAQPVMAEAEPCFGTATATGFSFGSSVALASAPHRIRKR